MSIVKYQLALALCLLLTPTLAINLLNSEFHTGFETGIILRNNLEGQEEYACPLPLEQYNTAQIENMMKPMLLMSSMVNAPELVTLTHSIQLFVTHLNGLTGVFYDYQGSDFCAGMLFGANGANLLFNMADLVQTFDEMDNSDETGAKERFEASG